MKHSAEKYDLSRLGKAGRIIAMAAAHHRFNYIHPFPDGKALDMRAERASVPLK